MGGLLTETHCEFSTRLYARLARVRFLFNLIHRMKRMGLHPANLAYPVQEFSEFLFPGLFD
jgi:hypothetical protein